MRKKESGNSQLCIGFDFDGVLAYSPTRLLRAPISWVKRNVLKKKGELKFFVPKRNWQMSLWAAVFGPSVLPEKGLDILISLSENKNIKMHLITGRFDFLEKSMKNWLAKQNITDIFQTININSHREQPHRFKERLIKKYKLMYFVEDNWDAVEYLTRKCPKTKILWIFNLLDRNIDYPLKFSYLGSALEYVQKENSV